jgi:flagellar hook assembly protein FlgD
MVITGQLTFAIPPVAADDTPAPLAVFIVGPSASLTSSNLDDAAAMARQASDIGMRVRKVFHPHATWENVLDAIQGASLVVYMGHGNGWPSPNGPFQEDTKDGFGLDPQAGASAYTTAYYGADKLRKKVQLAKNAVVLLVHLCYASGNGEEYMGPEFDKDIATKRVDNFASGFLDIGARAVFAFGMDQKIDFPRALMRGDRSMDDIFESPNTNGMYDGFVGTRDYYRDSKRTGWARIHMDPHPRKGHYRAVTGDLAMTASEFRAGAGDTSGGGGSSGGPDTKAPVLKVQGGGTGLAASIRTIRFSPNGDHKHDSLRVRWSLTERASIRVVVRNSHHDVVRSYSRSGRRGHGTITWDGRNDAGKLVRDGAYRVTLTPRDKAGNAGTGRTVNALVLTSVKSASQSRSAIYSADRDSYAQSTRIAFTLTQRARVTWTIRDGDGRTVLTHVNGTSMAKGRHAWSWDGRDHKGRFVQSGDYRAVITVRTSAGTVQLRRDIHVGAFRIETSDSTPKRGQKIRIRVYTTEPLKSAPSIRVSQTGHHDRVVGTKRVGSSYLTTVTLRSSGKAGSLRISAIGTDKGGAKQSFTQVLHLH